MDDWTVVSGGVRVCEKRMDEVGGGLGTTGAERRVTGGSRDNGLKTEADC